MLTNLVPKSTIDDYVCTNCDYKTSRKSQFDRHLLTAKHKKLTNLTKIVPNGSEEHICGLCKKNYSTRVGLWYHKKKCTFKEVHASEEMTKNELIKQLMIQNQQLIFDNKEFKELILDQSSKMLELASKPSSVINNNNSNNNNKQFNLNVFLNERCKNAMNMSDFIDSIQIEDDDFENMGKLGYVQGISNIFIKGLKDLDETVRPLHCSDIKRETLYIKDNDVWDKDDNKKHVKHAIAMIAHKNIKYIPIWTEANPQALDGTTKINEQYMRIANQVTSAITPDDDSGINKIIRNVANKVCIEK